jgi:hypothetical protein
MVNNLGTPWRISEDAIANPVGGETVILHLGNGHYFGLDAIGTLLWEGLQAGKLPSEVCEDILAGYEVERDEVERDLARFLAELEEHDLVERA